MSETERLWALARYASERDRVRVDVTPRSPGKPQRANWRRWLARCFVSGLTIDALFVGTNRSLNVGVTSSDYVSFAQIGTLLYAALALAVLARWVWRQEGKGEPAQALRTRPSRWMGAQLMENAWRTPTRPIPQPRRYRRYKPINGVSI